MILIIEYLETGKLPVDEQISLKAVAESPKFYPIDGVLYLSAQALINGALLSRST